MDKIDYNFEKFITLTHRQTNFKGVIAEIVAYTREDTEKDYRIIIGTDSEGYGDIPYASAIVVHRVGAGGRAFICKNIVFTHSSLRQKIYNEATLSLLLAQQIVPVLTEHLGEDFVHNNFMIHIDIGQNGDTKDMIKEVVGMVKGSGFQVAIKPESYAASNVADRFALPPRNFVPAK
ncbi:MAG: ribonuclease H-like YkuK family protein [Candidatus Spechtbacterales bacterium]